MASRDTPTGTCDSCWFGPVEVWKVGRIWKRYKCRLCIEAPSCGSIFTGPITPTLCYIGNAILAALKEARP